ncbi:MAG: hypothetical protein ONB06_09950, partial [candidate division KSB1 bacterium]|nr:hypothetical protein [candidate division KSB1 bacterium]
LHLARYASFFEPRPFIVLGQLRVIPDLVIIVLGVIPLACFLVTTYAKLKAPALKGGDSVWKALGTEL